MDKKQQVQVIITAVLGLVMIFAWMNTFKFLAKRSSARSSRPVSAAVSAANTNLIVSPSKILTQNENNTDWGRDPFSGKVYSFSHEVGADLNLTGIIFDGKSPQALINDKIAGVGAIVSGWRILEIKPNKVTLSDGTNKIELKLK